MLSSFPKIPFPVHTNFVHLQVSVKIILYSVPRDAALLYNFAQLQVSLKIALWLCVYIYIQGQEYSGGNWFENKLQSPCWNLFAYSMSRWHGVRFLPWFLALFGNIGRNLINISFTSNSAFFSNWHTDILAQHERKLYSRHSLEGGRTKRS